MLDINGFSSEYQVRKLDLKDEKIIFALYSSNPEYYKYCPPQLDGMTVSQDLKRLPPHKQMEDKYYLGFFKGEHLIAVMDLIMKYPDDLTAFIGFFMVYKIYQSQGIGNSIIDSSLAYLSCLGYSHVRIGCVKGYKKALDFWTNKGFHISGKEAKADYYTVIPLIKDI